MISPKARSASPSAADTKSNLTVFTSSSTNSQISSCNSNQATHTPIISLQQQTAPDSECILAERRINSSIDSKNNLFPSISTSANTESQSVFNTSLIPPAIIHGNNDIDIISTDDNFEGTNTATMESHFFEGVEKLLEVAGS